MAWIILIFAGLLETGWALGLKASDGFTRPVPSVLTAISIVVSLVLLSIAVRSIPVGTAYAVWAGIGMVGTVALGAIFFSEPASVAKLVCVGFILVGIVGLKLIEA